MFRSDISAYFVRIFSKKEKSIILRFLSRNCWRCSVCLSIGRFIGWWGLWWWWRESTKERKEPEDNLMLRISAKEKSIFRAEVIFEGFSKHYSHSIFTLLQPIQLGCEVPELQIRIGSEDWTEDHLLNSGDGSGDESLVHRNIPMTSFLFWNLSSSWSAS